MGEGYCFSVGRGRLEVQGDRVPSPLVPASGPGPRTPPAPPPATPNPTPVTGLEEMKGTMVTWLFSSASPVPAAFGFLSPRPSNSQVGRSLTPAGFGGGATPMRPTCGDRPAAKSPVDPGSPRFGSELETLNSCGQPASGIASALAGGSS